MAAAFARVPFDEASVDIAAARSRFRARQLPSQPSHTPYLRVAMGAAAAGVLAAVVAIAPLRSLASSFLEIFEPQHVAPIALTAADREALRALPDLRAYGTVRQISHPRAVEVATALAAAQLSGSTVLVPRLLPPSVLSSVRYTVIGRNIGAFTFSAARAAAAAARSGAALPAMPANLNGSTLEADVGPVVIATYGAAYRRGAREGQQPPVPALTVAQMPVPRIVSDGASVAAIESYLMAMPGVPATLRRQIAALHDPATTLPIPIDIDKQYARTIVVSGTSGLVIGDDTGLGAAVVWERNGRVYAVFGTLPAQQLVGLADGLK